MASWLNGLYGQQTPVPTEPAAALMVLPKPIKTENEPLTPPLLERTQGGNRTQSVF